MGKVISINNMQVGVGKTTTAINLSSAISRKGKRVLIIDADATGMASSGLGIAKNELDWTLGEYLSGKCPFEKTILHNVYDNLSVVPANITLSYSAIDLLDLDDKDYYLKKAIDGVKDFYDFVFIDCFNSLDEITVNALAASDSVIIPVQCEYSAMEGLALLLHIIGLIKRKINTKIEVDGILFTMYESRYELCNEVIESVKNSCDETCFSTIIPRDIRLAEAPSFEKPIDVYSPKSSGAIAYNKLAEEILLNGTV